MESKAACGLGEPVFAMEPGRGVYGNLGDPSKDLSYEG